MFFENQYQLSYVTPDLNAAKAAMTERFGVTDFVAIPNDNLIENTVWTPQGEADIAMRIAIALVGHLTLEILEPVSGATDIFTSWIEPGQIMKLHHIAMRCADIGKIRKQHEAAGNAVLMAGSYKSVDFIYVDTRKSLGHYMEYSTAPDGFWKK